jgi:hypothetical protein
MQRFKFIRQTKIATEYFKTKTRTEKDLKLFIQLPNCLTMDYLKATRRTINPEEKTKFFLTFFFV